MIRTLLAVFAGIVLAMIVTGAMIAVNSMIYPIPEELQTKTDFTDPDTRAAMGQFVSGLPIPALLIVLAGHGLGSFCGAMAAAKISGSRVAGLFIGWLVLIGGAYNLYLIPHPQWFGIVDLALYVPLAYFGSALVAPASPSEAQSNTQDED